MHFCLLAKNQHAATVIHMRGLADARKAELLTRPVLHADEMPVPMLKPGLGRTNPRCELIG
jgi:hypothetical protein